MLRTLAVSKLVRHGKGLGEQLALILERKPLDMLINFLRQGLELHEAPEHAQDRPPDDVLSVVAVWSQPVTILKRIRLWHTPLHQVADLGILAAHCYRSGVEQVQFLVKSLITAGGLGPSLKRVDGEVRPEDILDALRDHLTAVCKQA